MVRSRRPSRALRWLAVRRLGIILLADARDSDDELSALLVLLHARRLRKSGNRYGPRGPYDARRSGDFFEVLLEGFSDRLFRSWVRMSRAAFWHLHGLIATDPAFQSRGRKPQTPVKFQLACFLIKHGGASALRASSVVLTSEGSTYNFCRRVVTAIRRIRDQHLAWPGELHRQDIKDAMYEYDFPGCIGLLDATLIRLTDKPLRNGYAYWTRKKFYGLVVQAVCDHRGVFTAYELGWPGSVADSTVFKESDMWKKRRMYFAPDEYILADKGYPLTTHTIRPFGEHERTNDRATARKRAQFNYKLSRIRIEIEHAFGRLKGRFPVLGMMPGNNIDFTYRVVEAFMIVHNILTAFGDDPADIPGFYAADDDVPPEEDDGVALEQARLHRGGIYRRKRLLQWMEQEGLLD